MIIASEKQKNRSFLQQETELKNLFQQLFVTREFFNKGVF